MFKFQRIISAAGKWTDNLYFEKEYIGTMGLDEEGLWIKSKRNFTIGEMNLLLAQLINGNPNLSNEKMEILPFETL
ncbi:hypothetical protein AB0Y20_00960 [Heyndrickxia oleronia]|uniref:hypothetical protein n=1 Tax=Heyndrickxia oleronia TaxID=38875 RepID=UPI003F20D181